jgi:hypothetical protein
MRTGVLLFRQEVMVGGGVKSGLSSPSYSKNLKAKLPQMTYFLIAYLCMTGPFVAWMLFSCEDWKGRGKVLGVFILLSAGLIVLLHKEKPRLQSMYEGFLKASIDPNLPVACEGSLDEATAGLRVIPLAGKDVVNAGAGRKLILRGWIGSEYAKDNGTAVRMMPKGGDGPSLEFQVRTERRPDVAVYMAHPLMEWGGFQAESLLPKDLPLGRYKIIVESHNGCTRDQFAPGCEIAVISAEQGAALDAPLERELEERKRKEAQAAIAPVPTTSPTEVKKSKRRTQAKTNKS